MAIILTDDGTLDTVLRCEECGEEMRYNYDPEQDDYPAQDAAEDAYEAFVQECIDDATNDHECPAAPDAEPTEPQEGDITTPDHETFYQYGKLVLEHGGKKEWWFQSRTSAAGQPQKGQLVSLLGAFGDDHRAALRAYMDRVQFWPDVWLISDHGNAHRIDLTEGKE